MARRDDLEDRLAQLAQLRHETDTVKIRKDLKAALSQKSSGLLAGKAAALVAELGVAELVPEMEKTFHRLTTDALKRDKGCLGKTAIAKALVELEQPSREVFLSGIRCVQMEPVWGGQEDVAAQVRGWCAHGLVRMRHADAVLEIAPLLIDGERPARLAAVDALGDSGQMAGEALLRLKALTGDEEPEVLSECFNSLFRLEPQRSLVFVGSFLESNDPSAVEGAALALGESRLEGAIDLLKRRLELTLEEELQRNLYLALALTRRERAFDILLEEVDDGPIGRASLALRALALHARDDSLQRRLHEILSERGNPTLERLWEEELARA